MLSRSDVGKRLVAMKLPVGSGCESDISPLSLLTSLTSLELTSVINYCRVASKRLSQVPCFSCDHDEPEDPFYPRFDLKHGGGWQMGGAHRPPDADYFLGPFLSTQCSRLQLQHLAITFYRYHYFSSDSLTSLPSTLTSLHFHQSVRDTSMNVPKPTSSALRPAPTLHPVFSTAFDCSFFVLEFGECDDENSTWPASFVIATKACPVL